MGRTKTKHHKKITKRKMKRLRKIVFAGIVLLVFWLGFYVYMRSYIHRFDEKLILQGVLVDKTDLSGLDIKQAKDKLDKAVVKLSKLEMTFTLEDERKKSVPLSELGFHIDKMDEALKQAVNFGKEGSTLKRFKVCKAAEKKQLKKEISVVYKVTPEMVEKNLKQTFQDILHEPKDAKLVGGGNSPAIVEEVYGEGIDVKKTTDSINKFLNKNWDRKVGNIKLTVKKEAPKICSKDLKGITDLLGTFTTYYGEADYGRVENLKNGVKKITDIVLMPGEELSVDQRLEPFTAENGYYESIGFEGNEVVKSMGGGICQIATTLYNAVLLSELEVTSRYAHSLMVHYVEPSFDATVANDTVDFKFRNNLDDPVYIESIATDGYIICNIYGKETRDPNRTIQFVNEIVGTTPRKKEYKASDSAIGTILTEKSGEDGISANLYKVIYENGQEVGREQVNHSEYHFLPQVILVGTASDDPNNTQKMNEAIASQKEEVINNAINEITAPKPESEKKPSESSE